MNINISHLGDYYVPAECKGGICVDIGANCGTFSIKYSNFFSKIHYYEPIEQLFNLIQGRVKEYKNIIGFNEAVYSESDSKVSIYLHKNNDSGSSAIKSAIMTDTYKDTWSDTIIQKDINTVSLEKIFERLDSHVIDYMKVDCETSEYFLFINKDLSKIKHLGIEIHRQMGKERWNELMTHILKYFDNPLKLNLEYDNNNKELYFRNKLTY